MRLLGWLGPGLVGMAVAGVVVAVGAVATNAGPVADLVAERERRGVTAGFDTGARRRTRWPRWTLGASSARRVGGVVGLMAGLVLPFPGILLAPLLGVVGARLPAMVTHRAERRRRAAMDAQIPQLMDLLAAASSAGLSGQLALRRAVEALGGPLAAELSGALEAVDLGARWRDQLALVADRLELPDLRRTVTALARTETLGASLADSTADLAASVRAARRAAVTERARTAPVKMLFPLVFLVLPAFLLLTVVPVLLATVRSIR